MEGCIQFKLIQLQEYFIHPKEKLNIVVVARIFRDIVDGDAVGRKELQ